MKKLVPIVALLILLTVGCNKSSAPQQMINEPIWGNDTVTVAEVVEWLNEDTFSAEAAAEWDSAGANGGYLPIRCAERYLDTIINHYHVVFIPEP